VSSARIRFTAAERRACEDYIERVKWHRPEWDGPVFIPMDEARKLANVAFLVLMLTDAPARARVKAKAKPRRHRRK
jgi:hypothetical protein